VHPYVWAALGGVLIGLSTWLLLAGLGRVAGISGITCSAALDHLPQDRWRWAFLVGLVLGGTLFAHWLETPTLSNPPRSPALMALAGLLVGYGTVLGHGCTSGHGVCGLGRRSRRSVVAVATFMGTAFLTVYGVKYL
jgi:uncharacterized protein